MLAQAPCIPETNSRSSLGAMTLDQVRAVCLAFPHATEDVKWEVNLVFSVAKKMFAVAGLEPDETWLAFKCSADNFAELCERPGCRPAPYLARAQWVALETKDALTPREIEQMLRKAYDIVLQKLPKKVRQGLDAGESETGA